MRVVAEVDVELGLTRVVWIGTAQDVGKAVNQAVTGQIEGGTAQGLGLALMEEIQTRDGLITNASFTDYLIPTTLDMPPVVSELIEEAEPDAPYGVKGVGEPPTVVSTAASWPRPRGDRPRAHASRSSPTTSSGCERQPRVRARRDFGPREAGDR
jgi:CO/xanthine dehydrogenase Mo-binding subunit